VLGYTNLPDSTPHRHAATIPGIKLSHHVQQTAVVSQYSVHRLVFIVEVYTVFCEVRTENLYVIYIQGCAVAQAVNLQPVTAETRFRFQASPYQIFGRQSGTGRGFAPGTSFFFPGLCHFANAVYSSSSTCCFNRKSQKGETWEPSTSFALLEVGDL
jgi:hypothetical protein